MNHLKSLKISNSPLLLIGCSILSFGVTNFYFTDSNIPKVTNIIGQILLFPVYVVDGILSILNVTNTLSPIAIFLILLITYSGIVFIGGKIFEWRNSEDE